MCPKKANATSARKKDYYTQLLEDFKILDFVKNFTKDFTFHDKKYFDETGNTFPFILGIRETGTNIEDLAQSQRILHEDHSKLSMIEDHFKYWIVNSNQRWFFGNNGEIREISREETEKIFRQYVDEAMARKPITEPTKIWVTAKFNLGRAIEIYMRDYIEELQMGSLRIDEKTENQLINRYLKEVYQRNLDSEFSPAEQKEMQKIFAYDPEFSKTMKKIFPSAKIKKEILPMLKSPMSVTGDKNEWIVEKQSPTLISVRGESMQYLILIRGNGFHLQGVYPNGLLRMFDEPKKRKNQKFTRPMDFTAESLSEILRKEGVPADIIEKEIQPILPAIKPEKIQSTIMDENHIEHVKLNVANIPMVQELADGTPVIRAKDLSKFKRVMQGDMLRADKIAISQLELDQIKLVLLENGKDDLWETLSWILIDDKRLDLFDIHVRDSLVTLYQGLIYFLEKTYANFDEEFALVQNALKFLDLPLFESLQEVKDLYDHKISWKDFIDSKFGKIGSQVEIKEIELGLKRKDQNSPGSEFEIKEGDSKK